MTRVRIGLIGCGRMGRQHLVAANDVAELDVVAVVDPAVDFAPCPRTTLEDLLVSPDVDGVLIAAPTSAHEWLVRAALSHDKHVLCEKPLTLDPDEDLALFQLAKERKRVLQVGFWRRFAEPYLLMREALSAGAIGAVKTIRAAQWDAKPPPMAFCDPRVSGGIEIDCGVHEFDLARWLLGSEIASVSACCPSASEALAAVGDVDTVYGLARLSNDRVMMVDLTRTAGDRDSIRTETLGEHGSVVVEFADRGFILVRSGDARQLAELAHDPIAGALRAQLSAFAEAVRTGQPSPEASSAMDSRRALLAARAMRDARLDGSWRSIGL